MRTILPHTADLRAEITAAEVAGLYGEALSLLREILVGTSPVGERASRRVELTGDDERERLFRFLRELVYLADCERFLPAAVTLSNGVATVRGEIFDPSRHVAERQIKALTRHRFELEHGDDGYRCRMVFDL